MAQGGGQGRHRSRAAASKLENQEVPSGEAWAQDLKQPVFLVQSEVRGGPTSQLQGPQTGRVSLHSRRGNIFALVGSSTDWVEPTHTKGGTWLHSVCVQMFISYRNTLTDTPRGSFDQGLGTCGPIKLTCKSNRHVH